MKIGIIGAGQIGGTLTRRLSALGHQVFVSNSRGPESLAKLAQETGAKAVSVPEAAHAGELVIVTIPEAEIRNLPKDLFAGVPDNVVVIDTGNYYPQQRDGRIPEIESGTPFEKLLEPTADLAGKLHRSGLHHRDLYLCHFFAKVDGNNIDVRLIDTARVKRLPGMFTRQRWIVKDLAQFFYSTQSLGVTDDQRTRWLNRYAQQRGLPSVDRLRRSIERKVRAIARHDAKLKAAQPTRNISIPGA